MGSGPRKSGKGGCRLTALATTGCPCLYHLTVGERLDEKLWSGIEAKYGTWHCVRQGEWVLVTKVLTLDDAKKKYGEVVEYERGPRGGFRSMTVGSKRFLNELLPASYAAEEADRESREKLEKRAQELRRFMDDGKELIQELWDEEDQLSEDDLPAGEFPKAYKNLQKRIAKVWAYHHVPEWFDSFSEEGRREMMKLQIEEYKLRESNLPKERRAEERLRIDEETSKVMKEHYHRP